LPLNYDAVWKQLDALIVEVRKKGSAISQAIIDDLKSARTLISVHNVDPTSTDTIVQIEEYLRKVESYLLFLAEADHGDAYAADVMRRISEARKPGVDEAAPGASRFIAGIPPGQHWVRLDLRDTVRREELDGFAADLGLTLTMQGAHHAVIRGDKEKVKALLRRVAAKTRRTG
jgi:hypothetical protein